MTKSTLRAAVFAVGVMTLAGCVATPDNTPNPPPAVACPYGSCVPSLYYPHYYVPYYYGPSSALILRFGGGSHHQYHPQYHRHHRR